MKDLKKTISKTAGSATDAVSDAAGSVKDGIAGIAKLDFTDLFSFADKMTPDEKPGPVSLKKSAPLSPAKSTTRLLSQLLKS